MKWQWLVQLLTNVFFIPYMALRAQPAASPDAAVDEDSGVAAPPSWGRWVRFQ